MSKQMTSIDAAVGVTGTPTPLVYKDTGKPVKHIVFSCSENHLCNDLEPEHPSLVALVKSDKDIVLHPSIKDNVVMLPNWEEGATKSYLIVEKIPAEKHAGECAISTGKLSALIRPLEKETEYEVFTASELANSDTGEGIIISFPIEGTSKVSWETTGETASLVFFNEKDEAILIVIANTQHEGVCVEASSLVSDDGLLNVGIWTRV